MRIVTWNVNGIRRVHKDLIRQGKKSWLECLESLEGDVICIQELKSERATMDPIYVNVPGWRSYFTFPVDKKAYSGVAIYVREEYKPVKVETAICGPAYDRYFELDNHELIGGYPLSISTIEARQIDREGRAVVLDFEGFILIGTYCPAGAESDDRVAYRRLWWKALDERCRSLRKLGREVILTGDLNVHCQAIDQVDSDPDEYKLENLGPVGTIFHKLCYGDEGTTDNAVEVREHDGVIVDRACTFIDLTRHFYPEREKMFTCWSVKLSAREGNYGSRIDFVLATPALLPYFTKSDVRPDIHGSDHCPVYAHLNQALVEPHLSISRAQEGDRGRNTSNFISSQRTLSATYFQQKTPPISPVPILTSQESYSEIQTVLDGQKRKASPVMKDAKKSQKTISSFFKSPAGRSPDRVLAKIRDTSPTKESTNLGATLDNFAEQDKTSSAARPTAERTHSIEKRIEVSNAFASLFTRPEVPVCSGHQKPAKLQKTKKKGANQGREFWMCAMPLGDGQCSYWKWRKK
ncbi:DNA-(Apurinic or apyrimidinic site) lyase [Taphrina deformans PYCC 5710]|uniref:DNA-(apurinic or apyrimidinic site) endonuclease n=1 Tax=Taphrina deformans (strain PYCC 5710 / ATCC 11124 / CBS 356.35 / IMI 108563 / JCM 9778 / NBRC 8474) TaxID=1097556 RepID=R4X6A1_TAPDE|nr:DNA-(Apurinic or apyrimidinic site) lyase [Taphrina deformans PYCC 5710]|eukprot:CCG80534.1 DNA-(Apurinic or apyrimidinic site) lyase [Taphrina deformans PYCC 5710]